MTTRDDSLPRNESSDRSAAH